MRQIFGLAAAVALAGCGSETTATAAQAEAQEATLSGPAVASETRRFRDWIAVCDNGNACFAFGPSVEQSGWVRVAMAPGGGARPSVTVGLWPLTEAAPAERVVITIDGRRFTTEPVESDGPTGLVGGDPRPVIDAMVRGTTMGLSAGDQAPTISLSGAAAALLWIDERQGRLGTTTALNRRGDRPASAIPAPPALPVVQAAEPVGQTGFEGETARPLPASLAALPTVVECRAETEFHPDFQKAVIAGRLNASTELWGVPCAGGAYNMGYRFFLSGPDGRSPRAITLPTSGEADDVVINPSFEPSMQLIYGFSKSRGLGDCGVLSTWVWTGTAFALKAESSMEECWGVPQSLWPTTWRTRDEP